MPHFLRKAIAFTCAGFLLAPTFYLAFFYEGLVKEAYAQQPGQVQTVRGNTLNSGALPTLASEGVTGAAKCGAHILLGAAGSGGGAAVGGTVAATQYALSVPVFDMVGNMLKGADIVKTGFLDCMARAIAKATLRAITKSIVNWINSGFNGNPSFVQDFRGFMLGIADETIGEFIAGSPLSFLCSPFQLRVRIALAKSFASRKAPLCTLSQIVKNIDRFTQDFTQGGWPAFLEFTVVGTNNPFGGHIYADAMLRGQLSQAQGSKQFDLQLGSGFLSAQECTTDPSGAKVCKTTTPGAVVAGTLDQTLGTNLRELEGAKYFDEIIDALISQLMLRVLYGGLSNEGANRSSNNSFIFDGSSGVPTQEVMEIADTLIEQIDASIDEREEIRRIRLQSLSLIQDVQAGYADVAACWEKKSHPDASTKAANARLASAALTPRVAPLNEAITLQETNILALEGVRQNAYDATTLIQVDAATQQYLRLQASSATTTGMIARTAAQQELTQTQTETTEINKAIDEQLDECHAL